MTDIPRAQDLRFSEDQLSIKHKYEANELVMDPLLRAVGILKDGTPGSLAETALPFATEAYAKSVIARKACSWPSWGTGMWYAQSSSNRR